jgi:hypothetical protein
MLTPRGPLPQKVYWRRRMLIAAFAVLAVVTVGVVVLGGGDDGRSAGSGSTPATSAESTNPTPAGSGPNAPPAATSPSATAAVPSQSTQSATGGPAQPCAAGALVIAAATDAPSYAVSASPALRIVITNASAAPCTADLSDQQIELFVYFGDARIWGSHDCNIEPGTAVQTLLPTQAVTREIVWTGLSSVPGCTATRQRAAAGTYTLRPTLSGVAGTPSTFAFA